MVHVAVLSSPVGKNYIGSNIEVLSKFVTQLNILNMLSPEFYPN